MNKHLLKLTKKKYLWIITGGAGFIGSNLIERLLKSNQKVICIDNLFSGNLKNIKKFFKNKNFTFIKKDIREKKIINKKFKADFFIHLAALGSVPRSIKDPFETNDVNLNGSMNMFKLASDLNCKRFIFASSSSVYGDNKNKTKKENDKLNPISPYGFSKLFFEQYVKNISFNFKIKSVGLRFFNVFGPKQNVDGPYAAVIAQWINNGFYKKKMILYGDGSATRDFTYVSNVVDGIICSAFFNLKNYFIPINLACGKEIKLLELVKSLKYLFNEKKIEIKIRRKPFRKGDIKNSKANIRLAKKLFSYSPKESFDKGIKKYFNYVYNEKN